MGHFSCVFHLAAQAGVPVSIKIYESSSTNVLSALEVIDYCKATSLPMLRHHLQYMAICLLVMTIIE